MVRLCKNVAATQSIRLLPETLNMRRFLDAIGDRFPTHSSYDQSYGPDPASGILDRDHQF
jgi:hypothetical protein